MRNWTEEQLQAIEATGANLLVSAAAGSGKTAVLVERIIRLLTTGEEPVDVDRLLVVTFTKAAAGEMRERIGKALNIKLTQTDLSVGQTRHIRRQMKLLSTANISTLHAFCTEVIRQYFYIPDLDPEFTIADENEVKLLKEQVWEALLEAEYEQLAPDFVLLVNHLGTGLNDNPLYELLSRIYAFIQSQPGPLRWLQDKNNMFKEPGITVWEEYFYQQLELALTGAYENLETAWEMATEEAGLSAYRINLEKEIAQVRSVLQVLSRNSDKLMKLMEEITFERLPNTSKATADEQIKQQVQDLRRLAKESVEIWQETVKDYLSGEREEENNLLFELFQCVYRLEEQFIHDYQELKKRRGILDFNDLEHYALEILEKEEAADDFRKKFEYIFIDEYQDSNAVQEELINRIARHDNVFMVGDVKQSIYRFRLADPTLFIKKYHEFSTDVTALNRRIDLQANFRSRPEIIEGINRIFRVLMSEDTGEIAYDEEAELKSGLPVRADENSTAALEITLAVTGKEAKELGVADEVNTDESAGSGSRAWVAEMGTAETEARYLADRIKKLMSEEIYDVQTGTKRKVKYNDIVILLRSPAGRAAVFSDVFQSEGIPLYADVGDGYFRTVELEVFMNLLRIIDNKRQDIPLLSVLRSPIGKFSVEELVDIRLTQKEGDFWSCMVAYPERDAEKNLTTVSKLDAFMKALAAWQSEVKFVPLDEFIWKLWDETGYYDYVGGMPAGYQRQANLKLLWEQAQQFMNTTFSGLFHFLKFMEETETRGRDFGTAKIINENDNVVRLMSVHKSKGLEFLVVMVAGLGSRFNLRDLSEDVLLHKDLGIAPIYTDTERSVRIESRIRSVVKNKLRQENLAEEMRILYVALTRAREKLVIMGSVISLSAAVNRWSRKANAYNILQASAPLDWLGMVIWNALEGDDFPLPGSEPVDIEHEELTFRLQVISNLQLRAESETAYRNREERLRRLDDLRRYEISSKRDAFMSWEYPQPQAGLMPAKLSVTGLIRELEEAEEVFYPVAAENLTIDLEQTDAAISMTGAERGTLLHKVLSWLDWEDTDSVAAVSRQIEDMCRKELILQEEIEFIDVDMIYTFVCSELGRRIRAAERLYREAPFTLLVKAGELWPDSAAAEEKIMIQGVIDLYFYEDGEIVLVDYKSDRISGTVEAELARRYAKQVGWYRKALERLTGKKVKNAGVYLLPQQRWVEL